MDNKSIPISPDFTQPANIPVEKPEGMSEEAKKAYDAFTSKPDVPAVETSKKPPISKALKKRMNIIENKLTAKMNRILKRRRKSAKAKVSRRKNRKK